MTDGLEKVKVQDCAIGQAYRRTCGCVLKRVLSNQASYNLNWTTFCSVESLSSCPAHAGFGICIDFRESTVFIDTFTDALRDSFS